MTEAAVIMDENAISRAVARICYEIAERNKGISDIAVIGIMSGGELLAERIAKKLGELESCTVPLGRLDITPFRDDEKNISDSDFSDISFDIANKKIILVDDVIFTGRSARAAMDAVIERGRPQSVQLAVLVDRGHRELPIRADYVGKNVPTSREEAVKVIVGGSDGDRVVIEKPNKTVGV